MHLYSFKFTKKLRAALNSTEATQEGNQERQADKVKASHESQCVWQHDLSVGTAQAQVSHAELTITVSGFDSPE